MTENQNSPAYTGDIAEQQLDPSKEYTEENQEIEFSGEQHAIWADLYAGIQQSHLLELPGSAYQLPSRTKPVAYLLHMGPADDDNVRFHLRDV